MSDKEALIKARKLKTLYISELKFAHARDKDFYRNWISRYSRYIKTLEKRVDNM